MMSIPTFIDCCSTGFCFLGRLFYLQIIEPDSNSIENDNAIRKVYKY